MTGIAKSSSQRHIAVPVLLLLSFVLLANMVHCRQAPYFSEVGLAKPQKGTTRAGMMSMRRLHTLQPAPLGYPPPPAVTEPPSPSPSPSPAPTPSA